MTGPVDAVVLGGGPAGAAAARLLSSWGHAVVVLPGARTARGRHAESLPPSCRKPLALLGLLEAVEAEGFLATRGNAAAWGADRLTPQEFEAGTGLQVERDRLDRVLLAAAAAAGATIHPAAVAEAVSFDGSGAAEVSWRSAAGRGRVRAGRVLDCTGRAGLLARGLRLPGAGPDTVAITAVWRDPDAPLADDPNHTLVESFDDGWAWSVPVGAGRRHVALMIDPAVTPLRGRPLPDAYLDGIGRTRHTARLLRGARLLSAPHACSATPYAARRYGGPGFLLVGDAASFIDPLSSFGVKKALASAWLAAVAVNTLRQRPEMADDALALFEERERLAQGRYSSLAAAFYREAAERHRTPFWQRRAAAAAAAPAEEGDAEAGLDGGDPRVSAAFESLRAAPRLALTASDGLRRVLRPTVRGREIVLEEHLVPPGATAPVRYFGAVDLPRLVDLAPRHDQVPALFQAYARDASPPELPEFLRALSAAVAFGLLQTRTEGVPRVTS